MPDRWGARRPACPSRSPASRSSTARRRSAATSCSTARPAPVPVGPDGATSNVIVRALADIGLDALVGDRKAWVNVTREFLLEVRPLPLPPERTVIELLEGQAVDAELLDVLDELRDAGFRIALDDFRFDPGWEQLVEHADAIKLDIRELPGDALAEAVERLRRPGLYLLAEKVETRAEYEHCRALGFDAFQGYFFAAAAARGGRHRPDAPARQPRQALAGGRRRQLRGARAPDHAGRRARLQARAAGELGLRRQPHQRRLRARGAHADGHGQRPPLVDAARARRVHRPPAAPARHRAAARPPVRAARPPPRRPRRRLHRRAVLDPARARRRDDGGARRGPAVRRAGLGRAARPVRRARRAAGRRARVRARRLRPLRVLRARPARALRGLPRRARLGRAGRRRTSPERLRPPRPRSAASRSPPGRRPRPRASPPWRACSRRRRRR